MGNDSDLQRIRGTIDNARREINRQKEGVAIRLLKEINDEIQSHEGTREWVEFSIVLGEAYAAKQDALAETFFLEAEEKAARVPDFPPELRSRLYEHIGSYYGRAKMLILAKEMFVRAWKSAVEQSVEENTVRIQLSIISVDLQIDKNPEIENFQTLKRVADSGSFTWTEQFRAWKKYWDSRAELGTNIRFARGFKKMTDAYFLDLLTSTRDQQP